jgi:hypothetical protein
MPAGEMVVPCYLPPGMFTNQTGKLTLTFSSHERSITLAERMNRTWVPLFSFSGRAFIAGSTVLDTSPFLVPSP